MSEIYLQLTKEKLILEREISTFSLRSSNYSSSKELEQEKEDQMRVYKDLASRLTKFRDGIQIFKSSANPSSSLPLAKADHLDSAYTDLLHKLRLSYQKNQSSLQTSLNHSNLFSDRSTNQNSKGEIELLVNEQDSIRSSNQIASEMIDSSSTILSSLRSQSLSLKEISKRAVNMVNEMGVSKSLSNLILKRSRSDCHLLIFGSIALAILICGLILWKK